MHPSVTLVQTLREYIHRVEANHPMLAADMRRKLNGVVHEKIAWTAPELHFTLLADMMRDLFDIVASDPAMQTEEELQQAWSSDVLNAWNAYRRA